jgi:RHS repeat-associated protein
MIRPNTTVRKEDLRFEITDHLGSVRAVVTGQKKTNNTQADITYLSDYYSYGLNSRTFIGAEGSPRHLFQGQEWDAETETCHFGNRNYNPKTGRWDRLDDMGWKYPYLSSYVGMGNKPTIYIDIDGNDTWFYTAQGKFLGSTADNLPNAVTIVNELSFAALAPQGINVIKSDVPNSSDPLSDPYLVSITRKLGTSYMLDEIADLAVTGELSHFKKGEIGARMYEVNGQVRLGKIDYDFLPNSVKYSEPDETMGKAVGTAHYHQNGTGPSPDDVNAPYAGKGKLNAVVNKAGEIYFYYDQGSKMGNSTNSYGNNKDWMTYFPYDGLKTTGSLERRSFLVAENQFVIKVATNAATFNRNDPKTRKPPIDTWKRKNR